MVRGLNRLLSLTMVSACVSLGPSLCAQERGPVWDESNQGDAGSKGDDAQVTDGSGELKCIMGETGGQGMSNGVKVDLEDLYAIYICDPTEFMATTAPIFCGSADFDTQLWLFKRDAGMPTDAIALLANDNAKPGVLDSTLLSEATDGTGAFVDVPGFYFLGISGFNRDPFSVGGPMFLQVESDEISGPDGSGGSLPLESWFHPGTPPEVGAYTIHMTGVTFAAGTTIDCNSNGIYDGCDIAYGESMDVNDNGVPDECESTCPADIALDDGEVDVSDLLLLLSNWGTGGPGAAIAPPFAIVNVADLLGLLSAWGRCPG